VYALCTYTASLARKSVCAVKRRSQATARNFGFLHPNSQRLISLLKLLVFKRPSGGTCPSAKPQTTPRAQCKCACCAGCHEAAAPPKLAIDQCAATATQSGHHEAVTSNTPDLSLRIAQQWPKSTEHVLDQKQPHTAQKCRNGTRRTAVRSLEPCECSIAQARQKRCFL
jgi:hypothetical protein